mgnify:CR=1 FL=1
MLLSPLGFPARLAVDHRPETSHLPLAKRIYSAPYGRTYNVVVDAFGIEMGADHRLKVPAEQPIRKFQPDLMGQFWRYLSGSKALHQMESLHAFFLVPHFLDAAHIFKSRFTGAAESGREQILLGFIFVEGLIDFPFQRFLVFPAGAFLLVKGIVDGVVEAVDGDHAGVSNSGFLLSWARAA